MRRVWAFVNWEVKNMALVFTRQISYTTPMRFCLCRNSHGLNIRSVILVLVFPLLFVGKARASYNSALLFSAIKSGNTDKVKKALKAGANVNATDKLGNTALIYASRMGEINIVSTLIKAGAHVNAMNKNGETALIAAALTGQANTILVLAKAGANINAADKDGNTALMVATGYGKSNVILPLLKSGANINAEHVPLIVEKS